MTPFVLETTYVRDNVAHTAVYTAAEKEKAKAEYQLIRSKMPEVPVQMLCKLDNKIIKVRNGSDYNFDDLALTVDVQTESGGEITYLCRKHYRGTFSITLHTKKGDKVVGCKVLRTVRRTEEQLMNQRNEKNFDFHRWFEDELA